MSDKTSQSPTEWLLWGIVIAVILTSTASDYRQRSINDDLKHRIFMLELKTR